MQYYMTTQFIPAKGQAYMYIEAEGSVVQRTLTHIPSTQEIERIPDPVVKMLFMPERLQASDEQTFKTLWG